MALDPSAKTTATPVWWKIFSGFRIALDIKKLFLAAAGIVFTALGWWVLSVVFYSIRSEPKWEPTKESTEEAKRMQYRDHKRSLGQWNLLHALAAPTPTDRATAVRVRPDDIAEDLAEYDLLAGLYSSHKDYGKIVRVTQKDDIFSLAIDGNSPSPIRGENLTSLVGKEFRTENFVINEENVSLNGVPLQVEKSTFQTIKSYKDGSKSVAEIEREAATNPNPKAREAFKKFKAFLVNPAIKPTAKFRTWPWDEDRGQNPFLTVTNLVSPGAKEESPFAPGQFLEWLFEKKLPVLVEPLVKLVSPVYFLFKPQAGGWNRIFLGCLILWSLLVWGLFGGAITRLAVVQAARNEKIGLGEALSFARERLQSYFLAPTFPLLCIAAITVGLAVFGLVEGLLPWFGDIVLAGLLWPVVILLGLIMAVVLVGLLGYPLMSPTISAEGSDSFDALSRSYSYVYQSPWQYIWYWTVALFYGAALIFFVGVMGSMAVYLGQWGMNRAPWLEGTVETDRTPAYFMLEAPQSFGWRDLLLSDSAYAVESEYIAPSGEMRKRVDLLPEYKAKLSFPNQVGKWMVSFWLGLVFLLIVGFGYSYFWTASSIIYLLMRKHVDETDLDEVYMEDDEMPMTAPLPATPATPTTVKPSTVSLNVVEAPVLVKPADPTPPKPADPTPLVTPPIIDPKPDGPA